MSAATEDLRAAYLARAAERDAAEIDLRVEQAVGGDVRRAMARVIRAQRAEERALMQMTGGRGA